MTWTHAPRAPRNRPSSASTGLTTEPRACALRRDSIIRSPFRLPTRTGSKSLSWLGYSRWSTSPWPIPAWPHGTRNGTTMSGGRYGIREGANDGNPDTAGDASFSPLGAPASNLLGPNFTPPFPAYPSGHADVRRGVVPDSAPLLRNRSHSVYLRLG